MQATFLTEADQESVRPRKTMKKKGPQRSQSRSAFPGSSRNGLGKTTSLRLLTMRDRSRLTVSQTGSVSVLVGAPNPSAAMGMETEAEGSGADGENGGTGWGLGVDEGGTAGELEMGMDARGGDEGRAGRTTAAEGAALMRLSISSMSDLAEEGWSGIVSPWVGWEYDIAASRVRAPSRRRDRTVVGRMWNYGSVSGGRGGKKKRATTGSPK
jgi:hypothetical protein